MLGMPHNSTHLHRANPLPCQVGTIRNACLARALLNIYVGRDPVSKPGKEAIGEGLAAMVLA